MGALKVWDGSQWVVLGVPATAHRICVARLISALGVTTSAVTEVVWDTIVENNTGVSGAAVLASTDVIIQRSGLYILTGGIQWQAVAAGNAAAIQLRVNGNTVAGNVADTVVSTADSYLNTCASRAMRLVAGDIVTVAGVSNATAPAFQNTVTVNSAGTYLDVVEML